MTVTETPFTRAPLFVSRSGTRHRGASRPWGPGAMCTSAFLLGEAINGLAGDVTCKRCIEQATPVTWDVVLPDKRYKTGYRVVHERVGDYTEAEALANKIIDDLPSDHALPSITETPHEDEEG